MKITKYIYVICGCDGMSRPFVLDVLHDTPNEFEHLSHIGFDVLDVVPVEFDLSKYGRS